MLRICNLSGIFTGSGFERKKGRHPLPEDCGFLQGPVDIVCSDNGTIDSFMPTGHTASTFVFESKAETLDGTGHYATAGFIDSHTHAIFSGRRSQEFFQRWQGATYREISDAGGGIHQTVRCTTGASDQELCCLLIYRLADMLAAGSTVVEIKSGYGATAVDELRLLRLIQTASHSPSLPHVVATFLGLHAVPAGRMEVEYVDEIIDVLPIVVSEQLARFVDSFPEAGFYSLQECERFARAAYTCGLHTKVHAEEITNQNAAARFAHLGATSVDHLEEIDDAAIIQLAACRTSAVLLPTTSLFLGLAFAPARKLIDTGVRVALATDFNPGSAPTSELQLASVLAASQMQMTAAEILCALTYNGAVSLRLEATHGTIAPGKIGDILLWDVGRQKLCTTDDVTILEEIFVCRLRPNRIVLRGQVLDTSNSLRGHLRNEGVVQKGCHSQFGFCRA